MGYAVRFAGLLLITTLTATGCALPPQDQASPNGRTTSTPTAQPSAEDKSCETLAASLTLDHQVGQLAMVGISSNATEIPPEIGSLIAQGKVGAVILAGDTTNGVEGVSAITARLAAATPGIPLIVAADQEGGQVQRLRGAGFARMPSASQQAKLSDTELRAQATVWGSQLRGAGVLFNLSPVADVVPPGMQRSNRPIGVLNRGFGTDTQVVSNKVKAVVEGYQNAHVATSLKHFPNLGGVVGNTDLSANVVDKSTSSDSAELETFRTGISAGAESVMLSHAVYENIDSSQQATFSPKVVSLLRDDFDFTGVIISDDLGAAKAVEHIPVGQRSVRFLEAGGDMFLTVAPATATRMVDSTLTKARQDPEFAAEVTAKAARVLRLKSATTLVDCQ